MRIFSSGMVRQASLSIISLLFMLWKWLTFYFRTSPGAFCFGKHLLYFKIEENGKVLRKNLNKIEIFLQIFTYNEFLSLIIFGIYHNRKLRKRVSEMLVFVFLKYCYSENECN